ncbi:MAG: hypothetical protein HOH50_16830, partial [Planctomycetaceae bacterium]|nr:hypothetical protein [Planctomycetaceae bacterium]
MTAATFAGHIVEFNFINDFDSILTVGAADLHSEKDPDEVTGQLWHRLRDDSIQRVASMWTNNCLEVDPLQLNPWYVLA